MLVGGNGNTIFLSPAKEAVASKLAERDDDALEGVALRCIQRVRKRSDGDIMEKGWTTCRGA